MRVSIIVPALNEQECIADTLRSLQQLEGDKEIIVVDGGSCDETRSLARAGAPKSLRLRQDVERKCRRALEASGEVLWFVHADTVPPPHALKEIRKHLGNASIVGGNFGLLFDGPSRAAQRLTAIYPTLRILGLCYGDSGIFVRREVYNRIGGFRALALFEDLDLLRRLRRAGGFIHLPCKICASSRRFEQRNFAVVWLHWTTL